MFWDTSGVVPLLVTESRTASAETRLAESPEMIVWWGTLTECRSAIARLEREGVFGVEPTDDIRAGLEALARSWFEVTPTDLVRGHADRLLRRHPLRAADALQLGAAMVWARGRPSGHPFCTADERLMTAARQEGFRVVTLESGGP